LTGCGRFWSDEGRPHGAFLAHPVIQTRKLLAAVEKPLDQAEQEAIHTEQRDPPMV
jgi:hypothetical protein